MSNDRSATALPLTREELLGAVLSELDGEARVVLVCGAGGIGKTHLARAVAGEVARRGRPVHHVDLDGVAAPVILRALAVDVLGSNDASVSMAEIAAHLERDVLLVVDTVDHAIAEVSLVTQLLETTPGAQALVTSRQRFDLADAAVVEVPPLGSPEAVQLFVRTALRLGANLRPQDQATIERACATLGHNPLAIELAAARCRLIGPDALCDLLDDQREGRLTSALAGGNMTRLERHRSITATLAFSEAMVTPAERELLEVLALVPGAFDLNLTRALSSSITGGLDELASLVDHHLLEVVTDGGQRFRVPRVVRDHVQQRLSVEGRLRELRSHRDEQLAAVAERIGAGLSGTDELTWRRRLDIEHDTLIALLGELARQLDEVGSAHAIDADRPPSSSNRARRTGLRLAVALAPYWSSAGDALEGHRWLDTFRHPAEVNDPLELAAAVWSVHLDESLTVKARADHLTVLHRLVEETVDPGEIGPLRDLVTRALLGAGRIDDAADLATATLHRAERRGRSADADRVRALMRLVEAARQAGQRELALSRAEELVELCQSVGHDAVLPGAEVMLTHLSSDHHDPSSVLARYEVAIEAALASGQRHSAMRSMLLAGSSVTLGGSTRPIAVTWFGRSLDLARELGSRRGEVLSVAAIAALGSDAGLHEEAAPLFAAVDPHLEALSAGMVPPEVAEDYRQAREICRDELGSRYDRLAVARPTRWSGVVASASTLADRTRSVLSTAGPGLEPRRSAKVRHDLTPRELEVLGHLVEGLTNAQVGEELFISAKTVMHHTSSIYRKLGVRGRAEAVRAAFDQRLLDSRR